jgi:hypothetical protein
MWRHPDVVNDAICRHMMSYDVIWHHMTRHMTSYDVIWRHGRHMTSYDKKINFLNFFSKFFHFMTKNDYFFNLVHFYVWGMHSLYLIFDLRVWNSNLKGYSTRVRSNKEPLFGKKVSNTLKPSKNPSC